MSDKTISGIVTWLRNWFYTKGEVDNLVTTGGSTVSGGGSSVDISTSWGSPTSDTKVASEKLVKDSLDAKADSNTIIQYELTLSDYEPKTGSTITVTCTCKNVLGNPISNKTVELFLNETSQGTATTNSNGVATWSITFGATRSALFRVENAYAYVNYNSWKLVEIKESGKVKVYANENMVALSIQETFTLTANGNRKIATISSKYAPNYTVSTPFHPQMHQTNISIGADGSIMAYNQASVTSGIARAYVTYPLKARMP